MKLQFPAAATVMAVALVAPVTPAYAQSKVNIYGLLDVGLGYVSNVRGHSTKSVDSNTGLGPSRIGFLGTEDLGGGSFATFRLETRMSMDTGAQQGAGLFPFWVGASYVGVGHPDYGTVTLGRQFDFLWKDIPIYSTAWVEGGATAGYSGFVNPNGSPVAVDIHGGSGVYDNTIKWLYTRGAWSTGLMYGLGGLGSAGPAGGIGNEAPPGSPGGHRHMQSSFVKYTTPTLELGAGWTKDNFMTLIANEVWTVRGIYRPNKDWTVYANYSEGKEARPEMPGSKAKARPLAVSASYYVLPNVTVGGGIGYARDIARNGQRATITEPFLSSRYFFSKTVLAYVLGAYNRTSDMSVIPATLGAVGGATGPSSNDHQVSLKTGILYIF